MPRLQMFGCVRMLTYLKQNLWCDPFLELKFHHSHLRASPIPLQSQLADCSPNHKSPSQNHKNLQGITRALMVCAALHASVHTLGTPICSFISDRFPFLLAQFEVYPPEGGQDPSRIVRSSIAMSLPGSFPTTASKITFKSEEQTLTFLSTQNPLL